MKKILLSMLLIFSILGSSLNAHAFFGPPMHYFWFSIAVFDITGAVARGISAASKYFLADDTDTIAELVWDEDGSGGGGSCGGGGKGNAYTSPDYEKDTSGQNLALNVVATSLSGVPAEAAAYSENTSIKDAQICDLALKRIEVIVQEISSLDQLSDDRWGFQYRGQQRSIQAMSDALTMKKAYAELKTIAGASTGGYGNYTDAVTTVASKRLLLDALMSLRKQIIAARVRARAETMELDMEDLPTEPTIECLPPAGTTGGTNGGGASGTSGSSKVSSTSDTIPDAANGNTSNPVENIDEEALTAAIASGDAKTVRSLIDSSNADIAAIQAETEGLNVSELEKELGIQNDLNKILGIN